VPRIADLRLAAVLIAGIALDLFSFGLGFTMPFLVSSPSAYGSLTALSSLLSFVLIGVTIAAFFILPALTGICGLIFAGGFTVARIRRTTTVAAVICFILGVAYTGIAH
jgi:hypothetical protein